MCIRDRFWTPCPRPLHAADSPANSAWMKPCKEQRLKYWGRKNKPPQCLATLLTAFYFGQKRTGFFGGKAREQGDGIASFKADMSARCKIDIADFFVGRKRS